MTGPASRRGFLRGLTTLPLIGGGVTLIGRPTAVAEPVTDALFRAYLGWLSWEHREALVEREERAVRAMATRYAAEGRAVDPACPEREAEWRRQELSWMVAPHYAGGCHGPSEGRPSTRAALVLSTVGHDWREAPTCP